MFTRTASRDGARPKSLAAFCTAVLAAAALAVLPALPANADESSLDTLAAAAAEARSNADAAKTASDQAAAAADAAAAAATQARADAETARAASDAAAAAALAEPENVTLIADAATTLAAFVAADAAAVVKETEASAAAAVAAQAASDAAALEEAAAAAEAAYEAAKAPPAEEVVEEEAPVAEEFSADRRNNNDCNVDLNSLSQEESTKLSFCFPEPEIDIDLENICPTEIVVELSHFWGAKWFDYEVYVNDVLYAVEFDKWGNAEFTVSDFDTGKFEVKVYKGEHKVAYEHEWIKADCPTISHEVEAACTTIGGEAEVEVKVSDLEWWRLYNITVTGPNDYYFSDSNQWDGYWDEDLWLVPGEYTVTVESPGWQHVPSLGPVTYTFTVDPCPGEVVISFAPQCAANNSGSLGATLSGLIPGREYHVTVEGPNGVVTDETFIASESTYAVPPAHLPAGTYTVTVVDTASSSGGGVMASLTEYEPEPEYEPLMWTAKGTISPCPALAHTGNGPSGELMPALALLPIGAGLVLAGALRNRRKLISEEDS